MSAKLHAALRLNQHALLIAWMSVGLSILTLAQLCSAIWAFANPMPHHWDNADYLNQAYGDVWAYRNGGPIDHRTGIAGVWDSVMNADPRRPPAYRVVSLPFIFWGMRMLPALRAVSLMVFWLSLYLIYRTGAVVIDGPAGKVAGIVAAMLLGLYSEIGWSIRVYGTEHPLYFAVALTLFCLSRATRESGKTHSTWIGLGFAMGLGALSKVSFALLAGPAICVALALIVIGRLPGLSLWKIAASAAIAIVMAWPFYHLHLSEAYQYGQDMTQFQRHSLHMSGLALLRGWVKLHINEGLGLPSAAIVGLLLALTGVAILVRKFRRTPTRVGGWELGVGGDASSPNAQLPTPNSIGLRTSEPASSMILMCLATGLPLLIFQLLFSKSDNVRHMTPAYLPLTLAVTLAAASAGVLVSWWSWAVLIACALPAFAQVHREYVPMTIYADDVWDLDPIYQVAQQHNLRFPMIGYVGCCGQFCDPTLVYPWARRGEWANSLWLWRPEDGGYEPVKVHEKLADRDLVVTIPNFHMPASSSMLADPVELDNAHNAEFADAMMQDPQWEFAGKFSTGLVNRAEVWMFVRKSGIQNSKNETSKPANE